MRYFLLCGEVKKYLKNWINQLCCLDVAATGERYQGFRFLLVVYIICKLCIVGILNGLCIFRYFINGQSYV